MNFTIIVDNRAQHLLDKLLVSRDDYVFAKENATQHSIIVKCAHHYQSAYNKFADYLNNSQHKS